MTPRKKCPQYTSLIHIGAHRDCGCMHRFKTNRNLAWRKGSGDKVPALTRKYFQLISSGRGK